MIWDIFYARGQLYEMSEGSRLPEMSNVFTSNLTHVDCHANLYWFFL